MPNRKILLVEDDCSLRSLFADILRTADFEVLEAREGSMALDLLARQRVGLVLCDEKMAPMDGSTFLREVRGKIPGLPVLMISGYATIKLAVDAIHQGAVDYLVKPVMARELLAAVEKYLAPELADAAGDFSTDAFCTDTLVAVDGKTIALLTLARRAAATSTTVLLSGASGVGKEVIARFIHNHSQHRAGPFIGINCAAIPATMLEAVLFGYEKGAFTGALHAAPGKFELAQDGTLLLDEISEMNLDLQAKLLRVLQERELERLGSSQTIRLNARILATTNRDLAGEVAAGRFRQDLYYRLNVFPLLLPPLAERPADILPLAQRILARIGQESGRNLAQLSLHAQQALTSYHWPGNVRELENVLQRAVILADGSRLQGSHLKFDHTPQATTKPRAGLPTTDNLRATLLEKESEQLLEALTLTASRREAASLLGISERTLRYKVSRLRGMGMRIPHSRRLMA